jgi:DNA-binding NtrC family response regulator
VKLNCAAVPAELIESELFGHEKGAFTGAVAARRGKFEAADGGTLFLDEVGDMPPAMQAKVLRALQEGELERVGGQQTIEVDVRVVAATNKDLQAEVAAGRFREDLFYRLAVVLIQAPALRERKEDLPLLADRFLAEACERNGRRAMTFARDAYLVLQGHDWPGNVRELRNLVERLAILCDGPELRGEDVAGVLPGARKPRDDRYREGATFHDLVEAAEREIIIAALERHAENVTETARALGLERSHLYKKMKGLGVKR